jgi:diacylglycerol kinase (ATP)
VAADGLSRAMILRELPRIRRGAHLSNPRVRTLQATSVRVKTPDDALLVEADGNVRGLTPATFRILPSALRILA